MLLTLDTSCVEKSEVQKIDGTLRKLWFLFSVSFPVTARDRIQILHFSDRKISSTYWADGEIDLEIQQMFANTNTAISGTHFQKFRLNSAEQQS